MAIKYFSAVTSTGSVTLRSCRAVMILVPIFGLHFLLLPIRPGKVSLEVATKAFSEFHENSVLGVLHSPTELVQGASLEYAYEILSSLSTATQGLAVSVLLCFSNHEVVAKLRQSARNMALYSPKVTTQ